MNQSEKKEYDKLGRIAFVENYMDWSQFDKYLYKKIDENVCFVRYVLTLQRHLLLSIYYVWAKKLYYASYVLGRTVVEHYINGMFVLDSEIFKRSDEFICAANEKRDPFSNDKKYKSLKKRASSIGLTELYKTSYESLCSFTHSSASSWIVFDPNHEKFLKDRPLFLMHMSDLYADYLLAIKENFNLVFPEKMLCVISECKINNPPPE